MATFKQFLVEANEVDRIVDHWKKDRYDFMNDKQLRDAVGDDLEQLEYSPEDIAKMVPQILKKIKAGK